jgi:hypothetical protein
MMGAAHHTTISGRASRDPGISCSKTWMALEVGIARLPHKGSSQVGYIRLAVTSPAMTV